MNYNALELHQVMAAQAKMFAFHEVMIAWETFVKVFVQRSVKKTPYIDKGFSSDALHENYSQYKRFNEEEIEFPSDLKSHLIYYIINVLIIFLLRFSVQDKLYCGQNIF